MTKGFFDTVLRGRNAFEGKAWFFKDHQYLRYNVAADVVETAPRPIVGNWGQHNTWPSTFAGGVDAVLEGRGDFAGKVWFFKGRDYFRYNVTSDVVETMPKPIVGNWGGTGWPVRFADGVDAVLEGTGTFAGKVWFFRGSEYFRYNVATDVVEAAPKPIVGNWGGTGWPKGWTTGIDAAVYGAGPFAGKIYFFRGDQYIRYELQSDRVEFGPAPVVGNWTMLGEQWYDKGTRWGVDSVNRGDHRLGSQTLFDFVTDKCGMQPAFWGRYLDLLTQGEIDFLFERGCKILPIYRGATSQSVAGGRPAGQGDAAKAIQQANAVGVQSSTVLYVDIEPTWAPSRDWFLGWWERMAPSPYYDGIYFNGQTNSPFNQPYKDAFALRGTLPEVYPTYLWSQFPQSPNFADFRGCPTAREALLKVFVPITHPSNAANTMMWQFKINCLPFPLTGDIHGPVPQNKGQIDNNLATPSALSLMWGA